MKLLTIDSSTSSCSVALTSGDQVVAEHFLSGTRTLSSRLLSSVDLVLQGSGLTMADIDGLGVALGPGAFTALRVGIATVKGLALAAGKPAVGFSSLAMLAMNLPWASHPVCPLFDARKGEVYAGLYRCSGLPEALIEDCVAPPRAFLAQISGPTIFVGEGALRYREEIIAALGDDALFAPSFAHQPRASVGALLARCAFEGTHGIPLARL
ncbi:MAG TPA: tRNA (adenosine(37)-N6)-threonylcarbamoyltransferase complex dimerization subunit type 1 TsaB, partial [Geobacteraceae bacterium]